jgi:hypothetical protein
MCLDPLLPETGIEVGESHHCRDLDQDFRGSLRSDLDCREAMPESRSAGIRLGLSDCNFGLVG